SCPGRRRPLHPFPTRRSSDLRPLPLEVDVLRTDAAPDTLFETQSGIRIRELNEALWAAGLGLVNMGGYDGQTVAGVISTSTHGRSEEHTSELQSRSELVCRLL